MKRPTRALSTVKECVRRGPSRAPVRPRLALGLCVVITVLSAPALAFAAGAPPAAEGDDAATRDWNHDVVRAARHAALARVEARSGLSARAAEHFRAAYRAQPRLDYLLSYAEAAEKSGWLAEARDAYAEALHHDIDDVRKAQLEKKRDAIAARVPASLLPVLIEATPADAVIRVIPSDTLGAPRLVIGSARVHLAPGRYTVETTADGFHPEKTELRVGDDGALYTVALRERRLEDLPIAGSAIVQRAPEPAPRPEPAPEPQQEPKREPRDIAAKEPQPDRTPEPKPEPKPEPRDKTVVAKKPELQPMDPEAGKPDPGVRKRAPAGGKGFVREVGPWAVVGLGVAGIGAASVMGAKALGTRTRANDLDPASPTYRQDLDSHVSDARSQAKLATALFATGGAVVLAGGAWLVVESMFPAKRRSAAAPRGDDTTAQRGAHDGAAASLAPSSVRVGPSSMVATWRF